MEIKPLDKRGKNGIEYSYSKMIKVLKNEIEYYIFAMKIKKIEKPLVVKRKERQKIILDSGYTYIQILPIGENYSLTMTYDKLGNVIEFYFDVTYSNFLDDRNMPFYEDLYLDVVITMDKEIFLLDKDELDRALKIGDITKDMYEFAIKQSKLISLNALENFETLKPISQKMYNTFFNKKVLSKDYKNTYRVNIRPGIKVAIVLKKDQKTGILTEGIVEKILTNSSIHHRGIKVRLTDGKVGRVQKIL